MNSVSKTIKRLLIEEPYYGLFALGLNKSFSNEVASLGVCLNGINFQLLINKNYWYSLSDDYKLGCIKHELLHLVFYHLEMAHSFSNETKFNIAADAEVNQYINPQWLPNNVVNYRDFSNKPFAGTKYYYNLVPDNLTYIDYDDHTLWKKIENLSPEEKELVFSQLNYQIKTAAEECIKNTGNVPGELEMIIKKLLIIQPKVLDWKQLFRKFIGHTYNVLSKKSRRKKSRRFLNSFGIKKDKKSRALVAIDTSGSISNKEINEFFIEIERMYHSGVDIHILESDVNITREYNYRGKFPESIKGRGGTSFDDVISYYNNHIKNYEVLIFFTDGYGIISIKPYGKIIWVLSSQGNSTNLPGFKVQISKNENN